MKLKRILIGFGMFFGSYVVATGLYQSRFAAPLRAFVERF